MPEWLTPDLLKTGGNLVVIIMMLWGLYKLLNRTIDVVGIPIVAALTSTILKTSEALAVITAQLDLLHEDHKQVCIYFERLNGKGQ